MSGLVVGGLYRLFFAIQCFILECFLRVRTWFQKRLPKRMSKKQRFSEAVFSVPREPRSAPRAALGEIWAPLAGTEVKWPVQARGSGDEVLGARGVILNNTIKDSWVWTMRIWQGPLTALKMLSGDCMRCRPCERSERTQAGRDLTRRVAAAGCAANSVCFASPPRLQLGCTLRGEGRIF